MSLAKPTETHFDHTLTHPSLFLAVAEIPGKSEPPSCSIFGSKSAANGRYQHQGLLNNLRFTRGIGKYGHTAQQRTNGITVQTGRMDASALQEGETPPADMPGRTPFIVRILVFQICQSKTPGTGACRTVYPTHARDI